MDKYLLCRPQGGINDILCQIEKCCRYAEKTNRVVIVDTNYKNANRFCDNFDKYFTSKQSKLVFSDEDYREDLVKMSVFPTFLSERLYEYTSVWMKPKMPFCDTKTSLPTTFDFAQDYAQQLLVHHAAGGGDNSIYALLRMTLSADITGRLVGRTKMIGGPYAAVHIRHTDLTTDYHEFRDHYAVRMRDPLFIATDNKDVIEEFSATLGERRVISFSRLPAMPVPIHKLKLSKEDNYIANRDAILDLMTLSLSSRLFILKLLHNSWGAEYSGFSRLAWNLWQTKVVIKSVLGTDELHIGLD